MNSVQDVNDLISYISSNFPEGLKENQSPSTDQIAKIRELSKKIIGEQQNRNNFNGYEGGWRVGRIGDTRLIPQNNAQPTIAKPACREPTFPCFYREPPKTQPASSVVVGGKKGHLLRR
jgi:hypothetical protein